MPRATAGRIQLFLIKKVTAIIIKKNIKPVSIMFCFCFGVRFCGGYLFKVIALSKNFPVINNTGDAKKNTVERIIHNAISIR